MQVLKSLVISRFEPHTPAGGGAIRNRQNIDCLSALGPVDVFVIGPQVPLKKPESVNELRHFPLPSKKKISFGRRLSNRILGVNYVFQGYFTDSLINWLRKNRDPKHYDVIVVEELALSHYIKHVKAYGKKTIFDAHNAETKLRSEIHHSKSPKNKASPLTRLRKTAALQEIEREEKRAVRSADSVWACSDLDAQTLKSSFGTGLHICTVPNAIDIERFENASRLAYSSDWSEFPVTISYLGSYSYYPNEEAALTLIKEIYPELKRRKQNPKLRLIGMNPTPSMRDAAGDDPGIEITGAVDDIMPYLNNPTILTYPIKLGSGTRLKILEGFASERPVVSSRKGCEGIEATNGTHLIVEDDPTQYSDRILDLWFNAELRAKLCSNATELVRSRYSWSSITSIIQKDLTSQSAKLQSIDRSGQERHQE